MPPSSVLIVPGWQGSGPDHWQSRWEALYGYIRVEQHDWQRPLRGDWSARLEEVVLGTEGPVTVVAHSLGCILLAWWAAHSRNSHRVKAAFLVAPPDVAREDLRQIVPGWAPVARQRLPFATCVLASSNDPYSSLAQAREWALAWGSDQHAVGACGHINADSGLGDWPQGHRLLLDLLGSQK